MPSADEHSSGLTRLGLALAAPRAALALADGPDDAGRTGTDLFVLLLALVVAGHTRELVAAGWLGAVIDAGLGLRTAVGVIAAAVTTPLAALVLGAIAVFAAAGGKRSVGRDFDLACVAVVPLVALEIVATLVVRGFGLGLPEAVRWILTGAGYAWTLAIVILAIATARARPVALTPPLARGRRAGIALAVATALLFVVHTSWVIAHLDWLRPMASGDRVPSFSLPTIVDDAGHLGPPIADTDLRGKPLVIDFWATWCGPCLKALPLLSALATRGDVTVLSVNLDDAAKAHQLFMLEGYRTTLVTDADDTSDRFGVGVIPHLVVVDPDGVVRLVARGGGDLLHVIELATQLTTR